jgi:hypothetical protein
MVAGPEQCRRYAVRCMDLAREARTPSVRAQLEDLAHQWRQIASEIEKYREQIDELGLSPDRLSNTSRGLRRTAAKPMPSVIGRAALLEHLAQAERHVAEGAAIIARQKSLILELEKDGHDTTSSRSLLRQFEEIQHLHIEDRDRLKTELAAP